MARHSIAWDRDAAIVGKGGGKGGLCFVSEDTSWKYSYTLYINNIYNRT